MSQQVINVGQFANDGTGEPLRTAFQKINTNFEEVYQLIDEIELPDFGEAVTYLDLLSTDSDKGAKLVGVPAEISELANNLTTVNEVLTYILNTRNVGSTLLLAFRDAILADPSLATQILNILMTQSIASEGALPGYNMTVGLRTESELLSSPYPSPIEWEEPEILENLVLSTALVSGGSSGGGSTPPDVSITLVPPTNLLVGQTYTANVNPSSEPLQWMLDEVDVVGETATTFVPTTPGRVSVKTGSLVSTSYWARQGPTIPASGANRFSGTTFTWNSVDLDADFDHKVLYLVVTGDRVGGEAAFELSINATTGHQIGSTVWDGPTWFAQLYMLDNPGTSVNITYGSTDLTNVVVLPIIAAGWKPDAAVGFKNDTNPFSNANTATVMLDNSANGMVIGLATQYTTFASGPTILSEQTVSSVLYKYFGQILPTANTGRTYTASRSGSITNKRLILASIAPEEDIAP